MSKIGRIVIVAGAVAVASISASGRIQAEGSGTNWISFNGQPFDTVARQNYDRSFIRNWEANPPRGYPTLSRKNIEPTKDAIKRYQEIVKNGGWEPVPDKVKLELGISDPAVEMLQKRLIATGELDGRPSGYFDYDTEKALKRFQATNGLTPTGRLDDRTRGALNVSADTRLRQLQLNLGRLRANAQSPKARYVVVNIPAAQIEAIEEDRVYSRHTGVVGKIDRKTPILDANIHELNFNPVWRLPPTVINKDLIPKGREMARANQNVLEKFGIDAYSGNKKLDPTKIKWNSSQPFQLSYRQQPGEDNPLGFVKINFHNSHSVYLHDTPSDRLFGRNFRAASSGCVRVGNIEKLAAWLLRDTKGYDMAGVLELKKNGDTKTVRLKRSVPLKMTYITAWATEDGTVQFRRDLYYRDGVGSKASY
ncbi:MAG: L,D-transpeptidase family protein [Alphaproteobacteria bacterium]|nr:L,D-transpeptidase family protein [Alphaproteobacteria bacterium]